MMIMHDGGMDLDGNLWFTSNAFNKNVTLGRVDAKTGEVKHFRVNRNDGRAANAHGLTARQRRQLLVRRGYRPPRTRQDGPEDREDHGLPVAE